MHAKAEASTVEGQLKSAANQVVNLREVLGDAMSVLATDRTKCSTESPSIELATIGEEAQKIHDESVKTASAVGSRGNLTAVGAGTFNKFRIVRVCRN